MRNVLCLLFSAFMVASAYGGERLNNQELASYYTDMTVTAKHFLRKAPEVSYYGTDGLVLKKVASFDTESGTWWIDEKMNQICTKWTYKKKSKTFCLYTEKDSDGNYVQIGKRPDKILFRLISREQGNHLSFSQ